MEDATADDKIVDRLAEIISDQLYMGCEIIIISADRDLVQRCAQIAQIKQSSGMYLFKLCKQVIRQKYYDRP